MTRPRAPRLLLAALIAVAASLAITPASALAFASPYTFATQISGFLVPQALTVDSAGNVWVGDSREHLVSEYGPYPSTSKIGELGVNAISLALDSVNGNLYVANSNFIENKLYVFENGTGPLLETREINGATFRLRVATDNSTPSTGRLYISDGSPVEGLQAFEPDNTAHDFTFTPPGNPGEYDYLSGNAITGTPSSPFAEPVNIATDSKGNIYEVDRGRGVVDEFKPSGEFVREFTGAGAPGGFTNELSSVAVDPTTGNVLIVDRSAGAIDEFEPSGGYLNQLTGTSESSPFGRLHGNAIAINSSGDLYFNPGGEGASIDIFTPNPEYPTFSYQPISNLTRSSVTLHASVGPKGGGPITECNFEYGTTTSYGQSEPCLNAADEPVGTEADPIESEPPTEVHADLSEKLRGNTFYHYRLVLTNSSGTLDVADRAFETPPAVTAVQTDPATEITNKSATLNASFTGEEALETTYYFEYGTSSNFGHKVPLPLGTVPGPASGTQAESISNPIENLVPNTTYHYRFFAENKYGFTAGEEKEFTTDEPPTIEAFSTSEVTADSAVLHAKVNPQGFATTYRFEYGTTTAYGESAPQPDGEVTAELSAGHPVEVRLENLQPGVTYHFRVSAHNQWGTVASEDQSFEFFPPSCPNAAIRQQTGSAYLPDCRAYELVSPGESNGTLLFPGGPNTGQATSPSRFSFIGAYSTLPGQDVIGTAGDLYVATRTDTGWASHYVGLPGDQTGCMSGPPTNPLITHTAFGGVNQASVLADPSMSRILDWDDGNGSTCAFGAGAGTGDANHFLDPASNAPYLWSAEGALLAHLPTGLATTPGAPTALACPQLGPNPPEPEVPQCSSEVTASADLAHLVFSSNSVDFAEGAQAGEGLTQAPGSAYDEDLATGAVTLISRLPGGADIPQDPFFAATPRSYRGIEPAPGGAEEFLRFPAVSADGSHILISTATASTPVCWGGAVQDPPCSRFTDTPIHLYMSVDDAVTYEIAEGKAVDYVGMSPDGSKVYFTSQEHLTSDDPNHGGASLYMWSAKAAEEQKDPLTLISKAAPGSGAQAGDTEACEASWVASCGVLPYSDYSYSVGLGGIGGNGISDSALAPNGDIYFYSPEQLDGDHGVLNQQNLYDYRDGSPHYVTTLTPGSHCEKAGEANGIPYGACTEGPIARFEVTPDDTHAAFISEGRLTSYDNAGHLEMYSYTPATGSLVCDSCNPDGRPATADVHASQDGRFLTDDGRAFFSTPESLVSRDTNEATDIYEFVDGRPQLITPGTGTISPVGNSLPSVAEQPGLAGVSANGTDVYFSTFDTLISEDHNGAFMKFYDARTNGGFPQPPPVQPCAAAEECHGPGTEPPELPTQGTTATLAGGNATPESHKRSKKHHKNKKKTAKNTAAKKSTAKHHHARAGGNRGGKK